MKKIFYTAGPDTIKAGIAGMFRINKYKPVPAWIADKLLDKPMFREVGKGEKIELDDQADPQEFAGRENPSSAETAASAESSPAPAAPGTIEDKGGENA